MNATREPELQKGVQHDAGGKYRFPLAPGVTGNAVFSPCGRYRYWLSRNWNTPGVPTPYALWIGMNPSTAESDIDDPTIRREIFFTKAIGMRSYRKVNVMDFRSTDPKALRLVDPCSTHNLTIIADLATKASTIIAAWGSLPKPFQRYATAVVEVLPASKIILCLGTNMDGSPKHPLYVRGDAVLTPWRR